MPKQILVINGHPDPSAATLCAGLAAAYCAGAREGGHQVDSLAVGSLRFSLLRDGAAFATQPEDADILAARDAILKAQHLVFIFPLWLGAPPALFKAFMEQIARGGFALGAGQHGFPKGKLAGRSARVIVPMGMPAAIYRFWQRGYGVKGFCRGTLGIAGIAPVRVTYLGGAGNGAHSSHSDRLVRRAARLGKRAA